MAVLESGGFGKSTHQKWTQARVAGFSTTPIKHSLSFDHLAENELYEVIKGTDREFFKLEDVLQQADVLSTLSVRW